MCTVPKRSAAWANMRCTAALSETSQRTVRHSAPASSTAARAAARLASLMSQTTRLAPASARARANARPRPGPAPVTSATRPARGRMEFIMMSSLDSGHATQRSAAFAGLTVRRVADLGQGFVDGLVVLADLVDLPWPACRWPPRDAVRAQAAPSARPAAPRSCVRPCGPRGCLRCPRARAGPWRSPSHSSGSTLRMMLSIVSTAPSGTRRMNSIML